MSARSTATRRCCGSWPTASTSEDGPTHLAVILDASESTFRNQLYDQYKANRPPAPPELVPQFPLIRDATRAFSIPCLEEEGLEADDIIACYAKAALAAGWQVTIVSSDKDLMQLIEPGLDMLDTMNDRRIGREEVIEKFGVPPEKVGEVLALMGDSVDNVPGVPGIGPKTASKLIQEFGDVEAVLAAAPEMKPSKMRDNLIEHADKARLSRKLVELICDSPLPEPLEALAMKGIPEEPLREFLDHHGFRSLLARLGVAGAGGRLAVAGADPGRGPARAEDRPLALRDRGRRGGARRAGSPTSSASAGSRSTPRPTGATASRPTWSGSASPPSATRPATSRWSMAATTCSPSGPSSSPPRSCWSG